MHATLEKTDYKRNFGAENQKKRIFKRNVTRIVNLIYSKSIVELFHFSTGSATETSSISSSPRRFRVVNIIDLGIVGAGIQFLYPACAIMCIFT